MTERPPRDEPVIAYEHTDADLGAVVRVGAGIALVTALTALALIPVFKLMERAHAKHDPAPPPIAHFERGRKPAGPLLQSEPFTDWGAMQAEQQKLLAGYGWVDEAQGVTRIPVEEALRLVAARGLPSRAASPAPPVPAPVPSASPATGAHP